MTKKFGLLGKNIDYSLSPKLHSAIYDMNSVDGEYTIIDKMEDEIEDFFSKEIKGLNGINVTIPYKETVMDYIDSISDKAKNIGAVNTITVDSKGKLHGDNTDYHGFKYIYEKLVKQIDEKVDHVLILGSGGASKAIFEVVNDDDNIKKITFVTRKLKNVEWALKRESQKEVNGIDYETLDRIDPGYIIVNTTPIGTSPKVDKMPVKKEVIYKSLGIVDLIYNPEETKMMAMANKRNIETINGLEMLIVQGIEADKIWMPEDIVVSGEKLIHEFVNLRGK